MTWRCSWFPTDDFAGLTVAPSDPTSDVGTAMAREDIKSVIVTTEDCAVAGILTATDYMELSVVATDSASTTVADCMTTDVVTVHHGEPVTTAA